MGDARNTAPGEHVYCMAMPRRVFLLAFAVVATTALLAIACRGGDDPAKGDEAAETPARDLIAASRRALREALSFEVGYKTTQESGDVKYTSKGEAGYESGELVYSRMTVTGEQNGTEDVTEFLLLPPDMYLRPNEEGWFVQSPWNQGIRPDELPEGSLGDQLLDYEGITNAMEEIEQLPTAMIDGVEYVHLRGAAKPEDLAGDDEEAIELLEDADGSGEVELWLRAEGYLPLRIQLKTDVEIENVRVLTILKYEFFQYDATLTLPERPADARPYRDLVYPTAPCTGPQFAACLEPQTALQQTSSASCLGAGRRICLVPLGQVPPELVSHLVEHYRDEYGLAVTVLTPSSVPAELADPLREQVDAATLIEYIGSLFPDAYADRQAVLIGITAADLYDRTSHFRYLFGLKGTFEDPKAVVSFFRMTPEFYGETPDQELFFARSRKLLSKYVGLLYYDLPPSEDPESPMFDSILGPDDLDRMEEPLPVSGQQ